MTLAAGIQRLADQPRTAEAVVKAARSHRLEPASALAALVEHQSDLFGASMKGADLRLFVDEPAAPTGWLDGIEVGSDPHLPGRVHELFMAPKERHLSGSHLTPAAISAGIVGVIDESWLASTELPRVHDPAVGGASFLLAAADRLVAAGRNPALVLEVLSGVDIDPRSVAVAEAALNLWGLQHGCEPRPLPAISCGDGLTAVEVLVDLVVGNPPFLNQLRSSSAGSVARRSALRSEWPGLVGAYTDEAWIFLAAGLQALAPGGRLVMVQPLSILAARHAQNIRDHLLIHAELDLLWLPNERVFDASVSVCALGFRRRDNSSVGSRDDDCPPRRFVTTNFASASPGEVCSPGSSWGPLAADLDGVPRLDAEIYGPRLSSVATCTAGFRQQFYGFKDVVREHRDEQAESRPVRAVTVGMIDPFDLRWGVQDHRFAGTMFRRPSVDIQRLSESDPGLHRWVGQRSRPKLLVATQTSVIELWVDVIGDAVPLTPVISVEPAAGVDQDGLDESDLWKLAAALASPVVSVQLLSRNYGAALSTRALKVAARELSELALPVDTDAWGRGAELAEALQTQPTAAYTTRTTRRDTFRRFGEAMNAAYGVDDAALIDWWIGRLPGRVATPSHPWR